MLTGEEKLRRLQRALDYAGNTHRIEDVIALIKAGKAQWWDNGDGCIVTEVHTYPLRRDVHYWLIFGGLKDCLALEPEINAWAITQGCTMATATGRKGWGRAAGPTGWREWWPNFYRPLNGVH